MKKKKEAAAAAEKKERKTGFTKEQALSSKRYREHRDLLHVVLDGSGTYSLEEIESRIEAYRKGKVE